MAVMQDLVNLQLGSHRLDLGWRVLHWWSCTGAKRHATGADRSPSNFCGQHYFAVARIALVKPEKARSVEDIVLNAARRGQLGQKVRSSTLCI